MDAELIIVGAGPAGVSAALWARSRDVSAMVLEAAEAPGGQLHRVSFTPRELPGLETGTGGELAARYERQLVATGILVCYRVRVTGVEGFERTMIVVTDSGKRFTSRAVLVATGVRRRRLEVPGEHQLEGRGVYYSATMDRAGLRGKRVAIVGGGDAAYENSLILASEGCVVTLLVRDAPRARREFRDRVAVDRRVQVIQGVHVTSVEGDGALRAVHIDGAGGPRAVEADAVVIKVGDVPNTEWCRSAVALDSDGYVVVDSRYRTSHPGVWAAGDVIHSPLPSIATAIGTAALAVADIRATLREGA